MTLYEEYAVIDAQIKALTDQKEGLRARILDVLIDQNEEKLPTDVGTFSVSHRKKWDYPERILKMESAYKTAQIKAQSTGEATYEIVETLLFTPIKI
jgi:hypothetical protein